MTARAAAARNSGVAIAVASAKAAGTSRMGVGSGRPPQSWSSATLRAIAPAFDASRRSPSSSIRPLDATPIRRPATNRRLTLTFVSATFWWISLLAKRVSAESSATTRTSASVAPSSAAWARTCSASGSQRPSVREVATAASLTTCRRPPGRRGTARPAPRVPRGPPGQARPCRNSVCRASRSCARRRRRRTSARTRR